MAETNTSEAYRQNGNIGNGRTFADFQSSVATLQVLYAAEYKLPSFTEEVLLDNLNMFK